MDFLLSIMWPQTALSPVFMPGGTLNGYNEDAVSQPSLVEKSLSGRWLLAKPTQQQISLLFSRG